MNMKTRIKILFAAVLFGTVFQSCLKDQADVFDDSPTVRMNAYLANAKKVLMKPEKGWVMYYYPDKYQSYGGYNYTVKFDAESAEVGFELSEDLSDTVTSLYRLGNDTGPTLSFDTNNDFMHYFSTPSSTNYQALGGDFEFMFLEVSDACVKMMGRRSGNIIMMKPLEEDAVSFLEKVRSASEDFIISGMEGSVGGQEVKASLDQSYQQITFKFGDKEEELAYMFTPQGIRLYEPIEIGGVTFDELKFDASTFKLEIVNSSDVIQGTVPEGFRRYEEYEGEYWLYYNRENEADLKYDSVAVVLSPGVKNSTYKMSGLNPNYDITWEYDRSEGALTWKIHTLGYLPNGNEVRLCAMDGASGYFTWTDKKVMGSTVWNGDEKNPVYYIQPEYLWGGNRVSNSFYLCMWGPNGDRLGAPATSTGWRFLNKLTNVRWLYSLAKK